jgi:hypothetical protein
MGKYTEGRANIRGHKNWTIWNTKLDSSVSLSQASTSTAESSSSKRARTPPRLNSEGRDRRQQVYHSTPYFPIGLSMPRPWGPPSMMYPPCPPWAGWYRPWVPPLMHLHPGWSRPAEGFVHRGYYVGDGHYRYVGHQQDMRASGQENQTMQNVKPDHPISSKIAAAPGHQHEREASKDGSSVDQPGSSQGRTGPKSESLTNGKQSPTWRRVQRWCQWSRTGSQRRRQRPGKKLGPARDGCQTRQSDFLNRTIQFRQAQDRRGHRGLPHPGRLQHLVGVLQSSRTTKGGESNE